MILAHECTACHILVLLNIRWPKKITQNSKPCKINEFLIESTFYSVCIQLYNQTLVMGDINLSFCNVQILVQANWLSCNWKFIEISKFYRSFLVFNFPMLFTICSNLDCPRFMSASSIFGRLTYWLKSKTACIWMGIKIASHDSWFWKQKQQICYF